MRVEQGSSGKGVGNPISGCKREGRKPGGLKDRGILVVLALAMFALPVSVATAFAATPDEPPASSSEELIAAKQVAEDLKQEIEQPSEGDASHPLLLSEATDPSAVGTGSLSELGRNEAQELLEGVFGKAVEGAAGIFDELEVEKFIAPEIAVIGEGDQPLGLEESPIAEGGSVGKTLLSSTIPLRVEGVDGTAEALSLQLARGDKAITPEAPLVDVAIPNELGNGIELGDLGVQIALKGAPDDRAPSLFDDVAFYPNVGQDADLAVAPTPTGVETFVQLRTPDAARTMTYELELPAGAAVRATADGGAEITAADGTTPVMVPRPSAIDATGEAVDVDLEANGDDLILTASPAESNVYPILVDPLFQSYEWAAKNSQAGIDTSRPSGLFFESDPREEWSPEIVRQGEDAWINAANHCYCASGVFEHLSSTTPGLFTWGLEGQNRPGKVGDHASWVYTVPRFFSDQPTYGEPPRSYISRMTLTNLLWYAWSSYYSPAMITGLQNTATNQWVSSTQKEGTNGHSLLNWTYPYEYVNTTSSVDVKKGSVGQWVLENIPKGEAFLYVGAASVELAEPETNNAPAFGTPLPAGPTQWTNSTATPISFSASDAGLGVYAINVAAESGTTWKTKQGCVGVGNSACPRKWTSSDSGPPPLKWEPNSLGTGIQELSVSAEDPLGHLSSPAKVKVKVDHTLPAIALSGTFMEQLVGGELGYNRPSYTIKAAVTDGTTSLPQSGVASVVIEVDNQVVAQSNPGCSTQNCAVNLEATVESSSYSSGQHWVTVKGTDAAGSLRKREERFFITPAPPSLALSGTATEQATLGNYRPSYKLKATAGSITSQAGSAAPQPAYSMSFGAAGTGNGQFNHPGDVAIDSKGNLWTVDSGNNRIQEFSAAGTFLKSFGSTGVTNGLLNMPKSLAIDSKGNIWVLDGGNHRVQVFNEKGEVLKVFGSAGAGNGQLSVAEGIALDSKGNAWIADTYNARIEEFNEKGEFVKTVGTYGSGVGQLREPTGIKIGPNGNVWVTDWFNNKVAVYTETGEFVRQFGIAGSGDGQFSHPDAIALDSKENVWVVDQSNSRVQEFSPTGQFLAKFGGSGSGEGQFSFGYPTGITVDTTGTIWVTDTGNNRIQKWTIPSYSPSYLSAFGTAGTGSGQFNTPGAAAVDASGNLLVADELNNRVQVFNAAGEWVRSIGSAGSGNGQFNRPGGVAVDPSGNAWVSDTNHNRIEKFNSKGEFLLKAGTTGTGNGQLNEPEGLGIDSNGNIYVADSVNGRIQKFNEKGEFQKVIGAGMFGETQAVAIGPENNIWVAGTTANKVVEFNEAGTKLREFGSAGSGNGQFSSPSAIVVDAAGTVWVTDVGNHRVQGFSQTGVYQTQFGTKGTGSGQLSFKSWAGIAADRTGYLYVIDSGNNRVEKWAQAVAKRSEISVETKLDGVQVDSGKAACIGGSCPLVREWTLNAPSYPGKHTLTVLATDGLGNKTTKTINVEEKADQVGPSLESGGSLLNRPGGWVEQEGYGLTASAKDAGYGVTSLSFKIDGQQVAGSAGTCPDGACERSLSQTVNMAPYSGGAHIAELIAVDGASNSSVKKWTINVDPDGHVAPSEATATLEAAGDTSESVIVGPTDEYVTPGEQEEGYDPSVEAVGGQQLEGSGTPNVSTLDQDPEGGFQIELPEGVVEAVPLEVAPNATDLTVANGAVAVAGNTSPNTDSVLRPIFDGIMGFQSIRDVTGPTEFSWEVVLNEGQTLKLINPERALIDYADGTEAMSIAVEPAHDAVGKAVPTSLKVSKGNVLTMFVHHREQAFTYPVVAGVGWEGGYVAINVPAPLDELQEYELKARLEREAIEAEEQAKREKLEREIQEFEEGKGPAYETFEGNRLAQELQPQTSLFVGPPEPVPAAERRGGASSSATANEYRRGFAKSACGHNVDYYEGYEGAKHRFESACGNAFNPSTQPGKEVVWRGTMRGTFFNIPGVTAWHNNTRACKGDTPGTSIIAEYAIKEAWQCRFGPRTSDGNGGFEVPGGAYLRAQAAWELGHRGTCEGLQNHCPPGVYNPWVWEDRHLEIHLWPSGLVDLTVADGQPGAGEGN